MKFRPFSFAIVTLAFMAGATAVSAKGITPKVPALSDGCYQITDAAELYGFAEIVNGNDSTAANPSVCGKLMKDIVVNDSVLSKWSWPGSDGADFLVVWEPIKEFSGTFDGNGHVISGLYSETGSGLFKSFVSSSEHTVVVKDLGIIDSYFLTKSVAGVLVESVTGDGEALITNFYSLSELEATRSQPSRVPSVGGVVGYVGENTSLTLTNCYSAGTLVDNKYEFYSRLIGYPYSLRESIKINNCYVLEKGSSGNGVLVDSAAFRDGAVAYLLRENSSGAIWGQDVGKDPYPNFSGKLNNSIAARYTVEFHTFEGDTAKYFDNYVAGLTTMLPKGTSKENLIFGGWYRDAEFSGENDTAISNTTTGDLEYWARMYDRYKVTYHLNGGVYDSVLYYACGSPIASYQDAIFLKDSVECYLGGIGGNLSHRFHRDSSILLGWYDNEELTGVPVDSITTSDKGDKELYAKWLEFKRPAIDPADSCYEISNVEELYGFAALANGKFMKGDEWPEYVCGKLTKDIVINEKVLKDDGTLDSAKVPTFIKWNGAGIKSGWFKGQGHKISGLYVEDAGGLFTYAGIEYSKTVFVVNDLKIEDSFISGRYGSVGGVVDNVPYAGNLYLENVQMDGVVSGTGYVGGLVGESEGNLIVKNSGHRGIIEARSSATVGGIVAMNWERLYIVQSYNEGLIVDKKGCSAMGGLVGEFSRHAFVVNSYNAANFIDPYDNCGRVGGLLAGYERNSIHNVMHEVEQSFFLNNYNMGTFGDQQPSRVNRDEVVFENDYYISGTLPDDTTGVAVPASAFVDGTVAEALHDYVHKDYLGKDMGDGINGSIWKQGEEHPEFASTEYFDLIMLVPSYKDPVPTLACIHKEGETIKLPSVMEGYTLVDWTHNSESISEIGPTLTGDIFVYGDFEKKSYTVSIRSNNPAYGKVRFGTSGSYVGSDAATYKYDDLVKVQAWSEDGYHFVRWEDDVCGTMRNCSFLATKDIQLMAVFEVYVTSSSSVKSSSSSAKSSSSSAKSSSSSMKPSSSSSAKSSSSSKGKDALPAMNELPQFTLSVVGREIQVVNARVGAAYALLDMQGRIVKQGQVESANFGMTVARAGAYLVRIGNHLQKAQLK